MNPALTYNGGVDIEAMLDFVSIHTVRKEFIPGTSNDAMILLTLDYHNIPSEVPRYGSYCIMVVLKDGRSAYIQYDDLELENRVPQMVQLYVDEEIIVTKDNIDLEATEVIFLQNDIARKYHTKVYDTSGKIIMATENMGTSSILSGGHYSDMSLTLSFKYKEMYEWFGALKYIEGGNT